MQNLCIRTGSNTRAFLQRFFYLSSHSWGAEGKILYIDSAGNLVGSEQVHTVTKDVDTDAFGGPYTLTLGAAPNNAAKVRLSVSATAQIGRRSMRPVCKGQWYSITHAYQHTCRPARSYSCLQPQRNYRSELESARLSALYKNSSAAIDWSKVKFTYTEAGANDPTTPSNGIH